MRYENAVMMSCGTSNCPGYASRSCRLASVVAVSSRNTRKAGPESTISVIPAGGLSRRGARRVMTTAARRFVSDQSSCDAADVRLDRFSCDVCDRAPSTRGLMTQFRIEVIGKVDRYARHG